jgi:hypothetical protein
MKVAPEIVAALCRKHAPGLLTPVKWAGSPLDKVRLLWGIAGVESSFGWNCNPKHEAGYCYGGKYFDRERSHDWGCLAHCSYGPWQVMFENFPLGVSPLSLVWDSDGRVASEVVCLGAVRRLNQIIAGGAPGLSDIVLHYNGPADVEEYTAKLVDCQNHPMPEGVAEVTA